MLVVADSGSSKTDWKIFDKRQGLQEIQSIGLNPYFLSAYEIALVLKRNLRPCFNPDEAINVFFYGAGCNHQDKVLEMKSTLSAFFTSAVIIVESDMLASARALCFDKPGIVAILGTGSNTCVYDGSKITDQLLSLGYILGDEGSGAVLGKKILKASLSAKMPRHLLSVFKKDFHCDPSIILEKVYCQSSPNRFLASCAPFAIKHMDDAWMHGLLKQHLVDFFEEMIIPYKEYKKYSLNLSGSLAWQLRGLLSDCCQEYNIRLGKVIKQPIDGLMRYHLQQNRSTSHSA